MTVDELARRAGTLTSTVRMYQARRLLPGPERRGRQAFYGEGHAERLRVIERLQGEGFSLAAIGRLLEAWAAGEALPDVLGLRSTAGPGLVLDAPGLAARLSGVELTPELLLRASVLGVVEVRDDGRFSVPDERFLEVGAALASLGVPPLRILDEWAALRALTDQVAARFGSVFADHLWPPLAAGDPAAALADGTAAFGRLAPLARTVVAAALDASLEAEVSRFVAEHAPPAARTAGTPKRTRR